MNSSSFILLLSDSAATDPDRVGPKAANLAALAHAGLPTPGGFCVAADAYRRQIAHLGLADALRDYADADPPLQRRLSVEIRLKLYQSDLAPDVLEDIRAAWNALQKPAAVRSSALIEDRADTSFAGQFESFLGVGGDTEFLTALRACWAALWTTNARRSMAQHDLDPADTAMAVLIQPLIAARASGGGLSETADGHMLISATWGLGSTIAQGEVVPDRIVLSRTGFLRTMESGKKHHRETCVHGAGTIPQAVPDALVRAPCLQAGQATALGRLMRKAEDV
ncbi:MAG: PEP/pyruvate-binding domain-containing protein, partial [Xanthobacteraceae bacterium]